MLAGIAGIIITLLSVVVSIFALLSEELNKSKRLKYSIVGILFVFAIYAMIGSLMSLSETPQTTNIDSNTEPISIAVDATQDWQSTGVRVAKGDSVRIKVVGGKWTTSRGRLSSDVATQLPENIRDLEIFVHYTYETQGEGLGYLCPDLKLNECPVPNGPVGALIARVGSREPIVIGDIKTFVASDDGMLFLRINDGQMEGTRYLDDNAGVLAVEVEVLK